LPIASADTKSLFAFIGDPAVVMLLAVLVATFTLGTGTGKSIKAVMNMYSDAVKDIGMILLIIAGAGALKQVLADSGVSNEIAAALQTWSHAAVGIGLADGRHHTGMRRFCYHCGIDHRRYHCAR
jgi:H+/gluconate symporter-like permease